VGAKAFGKLTALEVANKTKPGLYGDGLGLYLQVSKLGKRTTSSWIFRYMLDGRARYMGLGPTHTISLKEARERARESRQRVLDGIDPIETREQERAKRRLDAARSVTFQQACERYIGAHEAEWKNAKHRDQWRATLASTFPKIGKLPVASIDTLFDARAHQL
jgi:hypothetical protein